MKSLLLTLMICLLLCSAYAEWTIVASYTITGKASGLAYDGTYLYYGIYGADGGRVFRFNPATGEEMLLFNNPSLSNSYGMTYDGQHLWTIDRVSPSTTPAYALQLDFNGNVVSQFDLPDFYMSGIAYDDGDFWVMTYHPNPGLVYNVTGTGTILSQFVPPEDQPWDICLEGDNLWIVDYWEYTIHKVDQTGTVLETQMSEIQRPAGIVYDGQYLWYHAGALGQPSTLYKVDLGGTGTPVIHVSANEYDFSNVQIDNTVSADIIVSNNGTGDLTVSEVSFSSDVFASDIVTPFTLEPTESEVITVTFTPDNWGEFIDVMNINSNDPINPVTGVNLTGYGLYPDPHIVAIPDSFDYGVVRVGADTGRFFTLSNQGMSNLQINNIAFSEAAFFIDEMVQFPINLAMREEYALRIWFNPVADGQITANAIISSNDNSNPQLTISLAGTGQTMDLSMGTQLWNYQISGTAFTNIRAIAPIEDIWGNGLNDVIICGEDNYVRAFNGNSCGLADVLWEQHIPAGNVYSYRGLSIAGDLNGDGYNDVVVGTTGSDRSVRAYSGRTGELLWQFNTNIYGNGGWVYQVDARMDFNGDGVPDVVAATGDDLNGQGPKRIFLIDGATGVMIWERYVLGPAFSVRAVNDFTGNGIPDVIAGTSNESETQAFVHAINGTTGSIAWSFQPAGSSVWAIAQIDDLTGNNVPDIVVGSFMGGGAYYALNATNGNIIWSGSTGASLVMDFRVLGDVNGNGYNDIAIGHASNHAVVVDGLTGQYIWSQTVADGAWNIANGGDLTGNGINDLVVGTLYQNNYAYFIDSTDGEILASIPTGTPVDAIGTIGDVTGDNSREMIVGGRNGSIRCYSGGPVTLPDPGFIAGNVEIVEGPGSLTDVVVSANGIGVNPDENGDYLIALPAGTYTVTASLPGYTAEQVTGVVVVIDETTTGIDFTLEMLPLLAPIDLSVDVVTGDFTWAIPETEHDFNPDSYNVFLDGEFVDETSETSWSYIDLIPNTTYIAGVSAVYVTGESDTVTLEFTFTGSDVEDDTLPLITKLLGNYPNPFNPETTIRFSLEAPSEVQIEIYNVKGLRVIRLIDERLEAGHHNRVWNGVNEAGKRQASGIYFYKFSAGEYREVGKMLLLK